LAFLVVKLNIYNARALKVIPPYLQRSQYIPMEVGDFGDGGAFPEIHVVQYPLNMGRPGVKSSAVVTVDVDSNGQVRFDAIVKQGTSKDKLIQTSLADLKEKKGDGNAVRTSPFLSALTHSCRICY